MNHSSAPEIAKKDVFRYIMEDAHCVPLSEENIAVDGINDLPGTPHENKQKSSSFQKG